jgi:uncharacterized protein YfaS (alpha-2-macroglobulin family)
MKGLPPTPPDRRVRFMVFLVAIVGMASPARGAPPTEGALARADRLFHSEKWADARAAYDTVLQATKGAHSSEVRRAVRGAVACSLKLGDLDAAWDRIRTFQQREHVQPDDDERRRWLGGRREGSERAAPRTVEHFELVRDLLREFAERATPRFAKQLADERIRVDFTLVACLLGSGFDTHHSWHDSHDWWWQAPASPEPGEDKWNRWWTDTERGIPFDSDGRPQFVARPAQYNAELVPGAKVLFLLHEIEQLDQTEARDQAAKALLHRALIARQFYGPQSDPGWRNAEFYYYFDKRPSFQASYRGGPLKPLWELADDEARAVVEGRLQVVRLPEAESPLTLLRLLERKYPHSSAVPEALYVRGLYYQSRQQFTRALAEYRVLIKAYPEHKRSADAKRQIERIEQGDVLLGATHFFAAGSPPVLWFAHRQTERVDFTARRLDLPSYLQDAARKGCRPWELRYPGHNLVPNPRWSGETEREKELAKYLSKEVIRWKELVPKSERVTSQATRTPLSEVGAYLVEARVPGRDQPSRALVVVTDIVILPMQLPTRSLLYIADARTGRPIANQDVQCFVEARPGWRATTHRTNADGAIETTFGTEHDVVTLAVSKKGGVAVANFWPYNQERAEEEREQVYYAITDRPVYRPGAVVQFRIWKRDLAGRVYQPPEPNRPVRVVVYAPFTTGGHSNPIMTFDLRTDKFGGVTGSLPLSPEAALGEYTLAIPTGRNDHEENAGVFRVEMYKKPEFEVTVLPADKLVRPGEKVRARISARYYFGGPVRGGQIHYQVLREDHPAQAPPQEYDWLYGPGYGQYAYHYPWLSGKEEAAQGFRDSEDWPYAYYDGSSSAELIRRGEARLNQDGTAEIEIDTAALQEALGSRDHRFIIEAEVRDESRRTIKGRGHVLMTQHEISASATLDRGWYAPDSQALVEVALRGANGDGMAAKGTLRLERIEYRGRGNSDIRVETVRTWEVQTDAAGRLAQRLPVGQEGQYRVVFQTQDSRRQPVTASAVFWVHGPRFDGRAFRYAELEIIPDRRSYRVGDTAHLLIHVTQPNARLLWSDATEGLGLHGYRFLDLPAHVAVLDVRVEARHVPNGFVQALVVSDGQAHTELCELFVPPVQDLLTVRIKTDKEQYRPGESGTVRVRVTDAAGQPVFGQLTLTAYDKAVTYVQEETTPKPNTLIARRRIANWADRLVRSEDTEFRAGGSFLCPEFEIHDDGYPGISMGGSPPKGGDPADAASRGARAARLHQTGQGKGSFFADSTEEPVLRRNFADTALWQAALELGPDGTTVQRLPWPDSLTTWRLRAYALTDATQVGDGTAEVTTAKDLLVRLQMPRFLVEGDEVVLSANVHSALKKDQQVRAELIVPAALFRPLAGTAPTDGAGNLHLRGQAIVKANGTQRFDWPVKVLRAGSATVTVKALTDQDGDAMQLTLPILRHGIVKEEAQSGSFRAAEEDTQTVTITVPEKIDLAETRLEVSVSPGPAGAILDALPMLIDYPYGCTEQTMSRFYPTILAADTLKRLGTDLESIGKLRRQNGPDAGSRFRFGPAPVFDSAQMQRMAQAGLDRLYNFQHQDGGWGWWQDDASSTYMTAYVLMGLQTTRQAGVEVRPQVLERGRDYLLGALDKENPQQASMTSEESQTGAYLAFVLSREQFEESERGGSGDRFSRPVLVRRQRDELFRQRGRLNAYGLALLALALHQGKERDRARDVLADLLRQVDRDERKGTAWVRGSALGGYRWWQSDTEINAWTLRALLQIDPKNELAAKLVHYLLQMRPGGHSWHSTRDTALVVTALADYVAAQQAAVAGCRVAICVDGRAVKEFTLTRDNFLTLDNRLLLDGKQLPPGKHAVTFQKSGSGELYYGCVLRYLATPDVFEAAGKGLAIRRDYYRLGPTRERIAEGGTVAVGDTVEVVLTITAANDCEYLAFEEYKPAGFEAVQLQSGGLWIDGHWVNVELRDDKVVFFVPYLHRGERVLRYRLRAESPGVFRALPASGFAMYAPKLRATSSEAALHIRD